MNKTLRRIFGFFALACWGIVVIPWIVLPAGDRLAWQLQHWMLIPASVFTTVYVIMLTICTTKNKPRTFKIIKWTMCSESVLVCVAFFVYAILKPDYKVWSDNHYVIYGYIVSDNENDGFYSPSIYDYYKRKGIVDDRLGTIGDMRQYLFQTPDMSRIQKVDYTIYEPLDLIKEEMDFVAYGSDSVCHVTAFYRLSNGEYYEQDQNDYLFRLINQM